MTRRRKQCGLTRIDVLAALMLAVLLVAVGVPLASEPRAQAKRVLCKANLGKIGKAMPIYTNDYDDALPRAGGRESTWGSPVAWAANNRYRAYGISADGKGGKATISSCFYLLVKYMEVSPRLFLCPGDRGTSEFKLADESVPATDFKLINAWDFGITPYDNCSYSYHMPFGEHALTTSRDSNLPVAADRNPWIVSPAGEPIQENWVTFVPDTPIYGGTVEYARLGNAIAHANDGQNVLFLDGRVTFETRSYCGVGDDNIYTASTIAEKGDPKGTTPIASPSFQPRSEVDSLLVHDPSVFPGRRPRR